MDIFQAIKDLGFALGQYVVVGSGIMAAYGLKEAEDIDLVVTPALFEKLEWSGRWQPIQKPDGGPGLARGLVEVFLDVNCGQHNPPTDDLIAKSEVIHGVPFISLEELVRFKREYGRPKDFEHIKLIEEFWERRGAPDL